MHAELERGGVLSDEQSFARSWDLLELDNYMADGGRYRKRRHAIYRFEAGRLERMPNGPHRQELSYNPLNGGVDRWFEPVLPEIGAGATLQRVLGWGQTFFGAMAPDVASWHIEVHQFRIEALLGQQGQPTPEGPHRDGVDFVLVLLVTRQNIQSGVTTIFDLEHRPLGSFTLTAPFDAALVDDRRVFHGVTAVEPLDPDRPAYRDVLVATWRARR